VRTQLLEFAFIHPSRIYTYSAYIVIPISLAGGIKVNFTLMKIRKFIFLKEGKIHIIVGFSFKFETCSQIKKIPQSFRVIVSQSPRYEWKIKHKSYIFFFKRKLYTYNDFKTFPQHIRLDGCCGDFFASLLLLLRDNDKHKLYNIVFYVNYDSDIPDARTNAGEKRKKRKN